MPRGNVSFKDSLHLISPRHGRVSTSLSVSFSLSKNIAFFYELVNELLLSKQSPGCENINKTEYHKVFIGEGKKSYDTRGFAISVLFSSFRFVHSAIAESITFSRRNERQTKASSAHAVFHAASSLRRKICLLRKCDVKHCLALFRPVMELLRSLRHMKM